MHGFFPKLTCLDVPTERYAARALLMDGKVISHGELCLQARAMAVTLEQLGVEARRPLGLVARSSSLFAWMTYAARLYGVTLIPLCADMDSQRRNRLLQEAGCTQLIIEEQLPDLPPAIRKISAAQLLDGRNSIGMGESELERTSDDIQLIIATSGSEGNPKGVMLSGGNLAASAHAVQEYLGLEQDDLWLCCLPLYHVGGISILYRCLDAGAGVLLHQGFNAEDVWQDLHDHRVTHISLVPAMLSNLLDVADGKAPPDSLRQVLIGGGPLGEKLASRVHTAGWPLCVSYGMSETASICVGDSGPEAGLRAGVAGEALSGFEIAISERGRIMLRGGPVMQGYANPELAPGVGLQPDGWFESGDQGELDSSGWLLVLGRADAMLVSGGRNIHPAEVESLLMDCPGVGNVAVTGICDEQWGDLQVAIYSGSATAAEVETWSREHLPSALRPRRFQPVPELPLNTMGKLDRAALSASISRKG